MSLSTNTKKSVVYCVCVFVCLTRQQLMNLGQNIFTTNGKNILISGYN
jgi:hypothetical protein